MHQRYYRLEDRCGRQRLHPRPLEAPHATERVWRWLSLRVLIPLLVILLIALVHLAPDGRLPLLQVLLR